MFLLQRRHSFTDVGTANMPNPCHSKRWSPGVRAAMIVVIAAQCASPAWAWGRLGHRVISWIAEKNLNPKAKAASRRCSMKARS